MEFESAVVTVQRIYLSAEECKTNNFVKCMEENCNKTFSSESNLTMHLVKSHKKSHLWQKGLIREYYCPELNCIYNSNKNFKYMRYLKQHYMKVHLEKKISCNKCNKVSFANEVGLKKHLEYCGVDFKCLDCAAFYSCYETLKTHSRRKSHKILNKYEYKPLTESTNCDMTSVKSGKKQKLFRNRFILPKPVTEVDKDSVSLSVNIDQSVQTECEMPELRNITTQVFMEEPTPMSNSETQTFPNLISKNSLLTAETQTIDLEINEFLNVRKSVTTQTNKIPSKNQFSNTSFDLDDDLDFLLNNTTEKNSSSTQTVDTPTNIYSTSTNTHDSIHTDTSDLLTDNLNDSFDTLFNCHTETQTDLFQDDLFNSCDFSSMYTQTCDPVLYGLGFNDCETQTALNNFLKSVESQTMISHTKRMVDDAAKDLMHHMETQTDIRFPQILEEIHS